MLHPRLLEALAAARARELRDRARPNSRRHACGDLDAPPIRPWLRERIPRPPAAAALTTSSAREGAGPR
jgi:hypothetical protein